ncbi:hypothetical protein B0T11DRAFT_336989 [Plectosphaerella cucumerina]|uniref:Uncharacterized protein n=1 Tax=Plectosphaerella cucumerina TaxID=40658 RepID=A0A8K0TN87_9PEZI|nr:hypothetical protein B0T11DRAFT_336989 [Plectosphaerella cucumerina]
MQKAFEKDLTVVGFHDGIISNLVIDTETRRAAYTTITTIRTKVGESYTYEVAWTLYFNDDGSKVKKAVEFCDKDFFFFLGALTLHFPGFMRPATSSNSWSTLMFPGGPVMSGSVYPGISDGIYEVNGTFGGTAGLELVSQVTGAPITMWNWINVISLACMLLASLIFIFQLGPKILWTRRAFDSRTMQKIRGTEVHGVRGTPHTVMRVFFSYFMTPVVAWTSYKLTYAPLLPVHHIIISVMVLVLIPVAFW